MLVWRLRKSFLAILTAVLAASQLWSPAASAQEADIQVDASTVTLKVGSGQQYGSLQAALDAIPGSVNVPYRVQVFAGTYTGESVLQGKSLAGGNITIENGQATKPLFTGASILGSGNWNSTQYSDVYVAALGNALAVSDGGERLSRVSSIQELARSNNAWFGDGGATYVRLHDLISPNNRALALTTGTHGLRVSGVAATIRGLRFEHFFGTGLWLQDASSSSAQSIWVEDIGNRGTDDAGILLTGSGGVSVVNTVATSIKGAGVRVVSSGNAQILNGSFFRDTTGINLGNSGSALVENNAFGLGFEAALKNHGALP